jgi:homoserine O-acetyltransferase
MNNQSLNPDSLVFVSQQDLLLDNGTLLPFQLGYQTYGTLNADKSNAILVCHALTGDQHVANINPVTGKEGWWNSLIGKGKILDTDKFFVICSNVLGGCMGSTGPASLNPTTNKPYGLDFPVITIKDMVKAQERLITHLGISQLLCALGGSMGGMQVLQWAVSFPEKVFAALPIATAHKHSAQNIAFHEVGRQAVMADPDWKQGKYSDDTRPKRGLSVARMAAHITYLSDAALHRKFGRRFQERDAPSFSFKSDFQVENYLNYQGRSFVERFDANSYLYITRAMDYFDLAQEGGGNLINAFKGSKTRFCVMSFTSDWLFPTSGSKQIVQAINIAGAPISFAEIESDKGHDAFLLEEPEFNTIMQGFISACAKAKGV